MAWVESHQSLGTHRKTFRLAELLNCDRFKAVGVLHFLWWWALDNADSDGSVGHVDATSLARGLHWPVKSADVLLTSLVRAGFVDATDGNLTIHDWTDFAGKLLDSREKRRISNREAQQRRRNRTRDASSVSADVMLTSELTSATPRARVPTHPPDLPTGPTGNSVSSEINPAGPAGWLPAPAHARTHEADPTLLADHLALIAKDRASRQASQPVQFSSQETNGA